MSRPPVIPVEDKIRIVLSVLAGELTVAEAARRNKVSETSVSKWKQAFLESGKQGLASGGSSRASSREEALAAEVEELKTALGEAHVEIRVWKKSAEGRLGPSRTLR
ncbi:MAG: helix-turn-helix domain-containing protein [Frankia sp.]|nr:helix-turn-helix domain-containing protein [Frankia sp.]